MNWLRRYVVIIGYWLKKVSARGPKGQRVTYKAFVPKKQTKIMSVIQLKSYLRRNYPMSKAPKRIAPKETTYLKV